VTRVVGDDQGQFVDRAEFLVQVERRHAVPVDFQEPE
jgi:hypothetical protein